MSEMSKRIPLDPESSRFVDLTLKQPTNTDSIRLLSIIADFSLDKGDFSKYFLKKVYNEFELSTVAANDIILYIFHQERTGFLIEMLMHQGNFTETTSILAKTQYDELELMLATNTDYTAERLSIMEKMVADTIIEGQGAISRVYIKKEPYLVEHRQFTSGAVFTVVRDLSRLSSGSSLLKSDFTDKDIITIYNTLPNNIAARLTKTLFIQFRGNVYVVDASF